MQKVFEHQLTFQTSIVNECLTEEEQKTLYKLMTKLQKNTKINWKMKSLRNSKYYFFNYHLTSKLKIEEESSMYKIPGHHHISMVTKNANENNHFYQNVLGLRRVKMTVNQDDPSMYHLFYGDITGSPGTELSFFEIPIVGKTYRGTNAITRIGLLVPSVESLHYWKARFEEL